MDPRFWLLRHGMARYWLFRRGVTLGVRGVVVKQGRVLLVRHTYVPGWHFPGGGVEPGETAAAAVARELWEEARVRPTAPPALVGLYHQPQFSRRDHVALFRVTDFVQDGAPPRSLEIADCRFFPLDALPPDLGGGARRRLDELFGSAPSSPLW